MGSKNKNRNNININNDISSKNNFCKTKEDTETQKLNNDDSLYPFQVMVQHYELSIINYTRFYLGWSALSKKEKGTIRPPLDPSFRQRTLSFLSKIDGGLVLAEKEYNSKIDEVYPF